MYEVEEVPFLYHQSVQWFLCENILLPDIPQNQQYTPGFKEPVQLAHKDTSKKDKQTNAKCAKKNTKTKTNRKKVRAY